MRVQLRCSRGVIQDFQSGPGTLEDKSIEHLHGLHPENPEQGANRFPQLPFGPKFFPDRAEKMAAPLLGLVNQKSEHHQRDEDHAQMFFPKTVVVL